MSESQCNGLLRISALAQACVSNHFSIELSVSVLLLPFHSFLLVIARFYSHFVIMICQICVFRYFFVNGILLFDN